MWTFELQVMQISRTDILIYCLPAPNIFLDDFSDFYPLILSSQKLIMFLLIFQKCYKYHFLFYSHPIYYW